MTTTHPRRAPAGRAARREAIWAAAFLLPSLGGFALFYLIPFVQAFGLSLKSSPIGGHFVGLANYIALARNAAFLKAALNTAIFTAVGVPTLLAASLLLALALHGRLPGRGALSALFLSPMVIPVASVVLVWQVLFDGSGALNGLLATWGIAPVDWLKSGWARWVMMLLYLWKNAGYGMVLYMSALTAVPQEFLEQAELEGAGRFAKFRIAVWPRLLPTTLFVAVMAMVNSFKVFREVYLLAGSHPHDSIYTLQHFMNNMFASLDIQKLTSAAFWMALAVSALVGAMVWAVRLANRRQL